MRFKKETYFLTSNTLPYFKKLKKTNYSDFSKNYVIIDLRIKGKKENTN